MSQFQLICPRLGNPSLSQLSCFIFISSITAGSLKAQTVNSAQVPSTYSISQVLPLPQLPPPQDLLQPPPTAPPELPKPGLLPPPQDLLRPPATPTIPEEFPNTAPGTITVKRFEIIGSTVFSKKTLAKVTAPFTNRPLSFAELLQVRSAVTQLYINKGYITSGAFIPAQTLQGDVVKIQVIEGGLEGINVTGTRRLNPKYVRDRLSLAASKPLNQNRLLEALQLLQLNPLIKNISAELSAGSRLGTSMLEVQVTEAKTFSTPIAIDNNRDPSVGSFERRIQLNEANLLGLGDGLSVGYSNTDGSNELDASYTLPINRRNGTLSLSYGNAWSNVIEPPFNRLNIEANFRYYDVTLRQPVIQTPRKEFALGLTASRRESEASFLYGTERTGFPLPGADTEGTTRISALRFFQEWTQRSSREVIAARSQFSLGLGGVLNSTVNSRQDPDSRFLAWRGQGQWVHLFAPDTLLLVRGDVQLSTRPLVPLEQFGLGGQETVRGYRQDALLTDNAAFASFEFRLPIYRLQRSRSVLQLAPFVDVGTAWNTGTTALYFNGANTLASVGLGLRLQVSDNLTARFDYGIPLVDIQSRKRTWQENGLYFSVIYNPF